MANYSGYTKDQYENQSQYLNNLINSGSAGQAAWAKNELDSLNSQYKPSSSTSAKPSSSVSSSGTNYTPGSSVPSGSVASGTYVEDGLKFKNNYTTDYITPDMAYAIKQTGGNPYDRNAVDNYVRDLLGRVGTVSANTGNVLTLQDIQNELNRLGFQTSTNGDWTQVGGQEYLTSGSDYDNLKKLYGEMGYGNVNIYTGQPISGGNYVNSVYNGTAPTYSSGTDLYDNYLSAYQEALNQQLANIEEQQRLAQESADEQQRQAYVAMRLGQKALNEQNAASGLQDSGYSESSNIALTSDYGNNLNTIANNYQNYLNQLSGLYADTALSGAGTMAEMSRQEYLDRLAAQQYADQLAQQQWENQFAERQYADSLAQQQLQNQLYQSENDLSLAKTRADAALNLGLWTPDVQTVYGLTEAQVKAALAEATATSGGSSRSISNGNTSYNLNDTTPTTYTTAKAPAIQDTTTAQRTANARNNYANAIKQIEQTYNLSPAEAKAVYETAQLTGASVAQVAAMY